MTKHWRILLLGLVVSGIAVYAIASQINLALLADALRSADYLPLIPAAILAAVGLLTRAQRWRVLLSDGLPLTRSFHILNIAYLVNGFLPFRLGEVARMWLASRGRDGDSGVPIFKSAGTIVVERLLDLLSVVLFIAVAFAAGPVPSELQAGGILFGVVSFGGVLFLILLSAQRALAHRILAFVISLIPPLRRFDLTTWFDHFLDGLQPLTRPRSLISVFFWTAISWGFSFLTGYFMMFAFYPEGDVVATLLFIAAASLAIALPAVPGNIGTYEASIILVLSALGYTQGENGLVIATAFALTVHFVNLAVNALLGVIGFVAEGVSLGQLSRGVEQVRVMSDE